MPVFARSIGIDYSGAQTPTASLRGLRLYLDASKNLWANRCLITTACWATAGH
jgi:hypothetical protein